MNNIFLTAEWRKLAMINYAVDPKVLQPYVPAHTELDFWNNTCYVSLIGFMFQNTKVKGFKIPFHVNFEEVNLRFYVKHKDADGWKRGAVFISEFVPRAAITYFANKVYKEHYETLPMNHSWESTKDSLEVTYKWKKSNWNSIQVITESTAVDIEKDSEEEFITEHYWGYTQIGAEKTSEYPVEHPRWKVYPAKRYSVKVDFMDVYGKHFKFLSSLQPKSVFLAEGSEIVVKSGRVIR